MRDLARRGSACCRFDVRSLRIIETLRDALSDAPHFVVADGKNSREGRPSILRQTVCELFERHDIERFEESLRITARTQKVQPFEADHEPAEDRKKHEDSENDFDR